MVAFIHWVTSPRKSWTFLFTPPGDTRMTLGTYPATSLAQARTLAIEARGQLEEGRDSGRR